MPTARLSRSGFTLIEILVAAAIISVLTGMGLAAYSRFDARKKVSEGALYFANQLRLVQKRADSGDVNTCETNEEMTSFSVSIRPSSEPDFETTADIKATCAGDDTFDSIVTLSSYRGVVFETSDPFEVRFLVNGAGVRDADSIIVRSQTNGVGIRYRISVETGGAIMVEEET